MSITLSALQKQRTDTAANWTAANPTLLSGELGFESDTGKAKLGTGSTAWNSLGYLGVIPSSGIYPLTQLLLPSGTAGVPSLSFSGDASLNTGIYSPGENQVAISTNGTGRLFVDSSGRVLVGRSTSVPVIRGVSFEPNLQVLASASILQESGGASLFLGRRLNVTNGAGLAAIYFSGSDGTNVIQSALIAAEVDGVPGTNDMPGRLLFSTTADGSASPTERMRLDSSGRLGLGTSTPARLLHLRDTSPALALQSDADGICELQFGDTNDQVRANIVYRAGTAGDALCFNGYNNTERMRIDSSGRLGLGTTSPSSLLHIAGNNGIRFGAGGSPEAEINYTAAGLEFLDLKCRGTNSTVGNIRFFTGNTASAAVEAMRIDNQQRVGIGTTSPGSKLDINQGSSYGPGNGLRLTNAAGNRWDISLDQVSMELGFAYNASNKVTIKNNGLVGIGTTSPSYVLDATANATGGIRYKSTGSYGYIVADNTGTTGGGIFNAQQNGVQKAVFGVTGGLLGDTSADAAVFADSGQAIRFYTNGSHERARIDSSGRLLVGTSSSTNVGSSVPAIQQIRYSSSNVGLSITRDGNAPNIVLARTASAPYGLVSSGNSLGSFRWAAGDGTDIETVAAEILAEVDGTPGANDMPGRLVFSVTRDGSASPTEAVRIHNNGYTNVFSAGQGFHIGTGQGSGTTYELLIGAYSASGVNGGTTSIKIWSNGDVQNTNNSYGSLSDIKLKENIVDANSQWDDLKALQVRNYNLKEGQTHTQIGLIAQEVELVSPGLVTESPDRDEDGNDLGTVTKSVNYSVLYMKAVKALQEAMERIEVLEQRLADAGIA